MTFSIKVVHFFNDSVKNIFFWKNSGVMRIACIVRNRTESEAPGSVVQKVTELWFNGMLKT